MSEHYSTFQYCTERQLKIASEELRKRNKKFLRARPLTAKMLADFITRAETVQSTSAAQRLLNQRVHDREARPVLRAINSGVPFHSNHTQAASSTSDHIAVESSAQVPVSSRFADVNFNSIERLKEFK